MKTLVYTAVALCFLAACNGDGKKDCNSYPNDTIEIRANTALMNKKFPDFPQNKFVIGYLTNFFKVVINNGADYEFKNEVYKFNGTTIGPNGETNPQLGTNTVTWTGDCKYASPKTNQYVCDCNPNMSSATQQIEVVDTAKLWIKTITYSKQWSNQDFGSKPDVYLRIKNDLNIKSPTTTNYDLATMGSLVWDVDDTITISDNYFNLQIEAWDYDWPTSDENLGKSTIKHSAVANWTTGTHSVQSGAAWTFEVVRL